MAGGSKFCTVCVDELNETAQKRHDTHFHDREQVHMDAIKRQWRHEAQGGIAAYGFRFTGGRQLQGDEMSEHDLFSMHHVTMEVSTGRVMLTMRAGPNEYAGFVPAHTAYERMVAWEMLRAAFLGTLRALSGENVREGEQLLAERAPHEQPCMLAPCPRTA